MTTLRAGISERPIHVRLAEPKDAGAISELYVRTYTPREGGVAREHYPFPQIMEEEEVIKLMTGGTVLWIVAEAADDTIAGSAAAVRNIGGQQDRIAEIFGVAVEQTCRRRGVGSTLLQKLRSELSGVAEFILCEARTAEAGGWKAARNAGFQPVGFEPYAHAMPGGFESMVLTASWHWPQGTGFCDVAAAESTKASLKLAGAVCCSPCVDSSLLATLGCELANRAAWAANEILPGSISVRRDDQSGQAWFGGSAGAFDRRFAVVEFCPFQGAEPHFQRFEQAYYVASMGNSDVAAARVFYDQTDARARIIGFRGVAEGVELQFLKSIVRNLVQLSPDGPLAITAYVRANAPATHMVLEAHGFFPTAYLPGMICSPTGRTDVVQYTRLCRRSWSESVTSVTALEWPQARRIIDQVIQFHLEAPASAEQAD
jgi:N-acetylglutamate synthase-like GNAT family acetyltransferase